MSLSNLTGSSAWTEGAWLTPAAMNLRLSELTTDMAQLNSDTSTGFTVSGSTTSLAPGDVLVATSIDSGGQVLDLRAFGGVGDGGTTDNAIPLRQWMNQIEITGIPGFLPNGTFYSTSMLTAANSTTTAVQIIGQSRRDSVLQFASSARTGFLIGDGAGQGSYVYLKNFSIIAGTSGHSGCGLDCVNPQLMRMEGINIEDFNGRNAVSMSLSGSTTAPTPHAYFGSYKDVVIANAQGRGLLLTNADENYFQSLDIGGASTTSSIFTALEIRQGRNNRFNGCVLAGNTAVSSATSYVGLYLASPVTGDNYQNQFYGLVAEGFGVGVLIESNATRTIIMGYNGSISSSFMSDGGAETVLINPMHTQFRYPDGSGSGGPSFAFSSDTRLGWYRSGASTIALSTGTLSLMSGKLSMNSRAASIDSTNLGVNELAFFVGGASGVSLAYRSGSTIYYFASSASTKG